MRLSLHNLAAMLAMTLLVCLIFLPAFAAGSHPVDLTPVIGAGVQLLAGLLGAAGLWATRRLLKSLGLRDEDRIRQYLDAAMWRGLQYAQELAMRNGQDIADFKVRSEVVATAANYVARSVPDALRAFGVDHDGLLTRLTARLPEVAPLPEKNSVTGAAIGFGR